MNVSWGHPEIKNQHAMKLDRPSGTLWKFYSLPSAPTGRLSYDRADKTLIATWRPPLVGLLWDAPGCWVVWCWSSASAFYKFAAVWLTTLWLVITRNMWFFFKGATMASGTSSKKPSWNGAKILAGIESSDSPTTLDEFKAFCMKSGWVDGRKKRRLHLNGKIDI